MGTSSREAKLNFLYRAEVLDDGAPLPQRRCEQMNVDRCAPRRRIFGEARKVRDLPGPDDVPAADCNGDPRFEICGPMKPGAAEQITTTGTSEPIKEASRQTCREGGAGDLRNK